MLTVRAASTAIPAATAVIMKRADGRERSRIHAPTLANSIVAGGADQYTEVTAGCLGATRGAVGTRRLSPVTDPGPATARGTIDSGRSSSLNSGGSGAATGTMGMVAYRRGKAKSRGSEWDCVWTPMPGCAPQPRQRTPLVAKAESPSGPPQRTQ